MRPLIIETKKDMKAWINIQKQSNKSIGFIPTMGALHEGHESLMMVSCKENDCSVLSIFVNPLQFGPKEDFSCYPRTFENDVLLAEKCGISVIFYPTVTEMYGEKFLTNIRVSNMSNVLCGAFRDGHFDGVCTVVLLLLNIMQANKAYFGQKDFQQLAIIKKMSTDLCHFTQIVGLPTVREKDGLAFSSRNKYLDKNARTLALNISKSLALVAKLYINGERNVNLLLSTAIKNMNKYNLHPQYIEIRNVENLEITSDFIKEDVFLAIAQNLIVPTGNCRLIDNILLSDNNIFILQKLINITEV